MTIVLLGQSLIWWLADLVAAALVGFMFAVWRWSLDQQVRWGREQSRYRFRVRTRGPYEVPPSRDEMLEALQTAMVLTSRRYAERLAEIMAERQAADPVAQQADRAHNLLENALASDQHLFLPDPLPVERPRLEVVT